MTEEIGRTVTLPNQKSKSRSQSKSHHSSHFLWSSFRPETGPQMGLMEAFVVCSLFAQPAGVGSDRRPSTNFDMWGMPVLPVLQLATTAPVVISGIPRLAQREVSCRVVVPLSVPSCVENNIDTPLFTMKLMFAVFVTPEQKVRCGNVFTREGTMGKKACLRLDVLEEVQVQYRHRLFETGWIVVRVPGSWVLTSSAE